MIRFFVLFMACLAVFALPAHAKYRKLENQEMLLLGKGGKTFLSYDDHAGLDRFYFSENGRFIQQINGTWEKPQESQTFSGVWAPKQDKLCWTYTTTPDGLEQFNKKEYCYKVFVADSTNGTGFLDENIVNVLLGDHDENNKFVTAFNWKLYSHGPYIYTQGFLNTLHQKMAAMDKKYKAIEGGDIASISGAQIDKADLPAYMQGFHEKMIGQVSTHPYDYAYYHPDGRFIVTKPRSVQQFLQTGDKQAFLKTLQKGQWRFFDDYYCRQTDAGKVLCEYIVAKIGLTQPYKGFLGHFYPTRFPRFHKEPIVKYVDMNDIPKVKAVFMEFLNQK